MSQYSSHPTPHLQPKRFVLPLIIISALIIIISLLALIYHYNSNSSESLDDPSELLQDELAASYAALDPVLSITPYYSPDAHFIIYATPRDSEPTLLKIELNACDDTLKATYLADLDLSNYELSPVGLCDNL